MYVMEKKEEQTELRIDNEDELKRQSSVGLKIHTTP